jgi:hypothetical protein
MRSSKGKARKLGRSARIGGRAAVIETGWKLVYILKQFLIGASYHVVCR